MKKITVQVRDDHLEMLAKAKPMAAVAELVWNALDADATEVRVEFIENELGREETIRIRDNGHGLDYDHAMTVFKNLGGSWKREGMQSAQRKRQLHGQYGKGRFRAFTLGNFVQWRTVFERDGERRSFDITGRAATLGEFDVTDPAPGEHPATGMVVEIADLASNVGSLRGMRAQQEMTDIFALYLRQYPDARIIYDNVPLDPTNAEDRRADYVLEEIVTPGGERIKAMLTVVEWTIPGKRGVILCDEEGFALHKTKQRLLFRGFSYTAYLKSSHFAALENEGLLQLESMTPDLKQLLDETRTLLRQHFTLREAERARDTIEQWKEAGIYPYQGEPANQDAESERLIFNIYATHLSQLKVFSEASHANKRLQLRLLKELVHVQPTRVARVLDELVSFPEEKEEEIRELAEA